MAPRLHGLVETMSGACISIVVNVNKAYVQETKFIQNKCLDQLFACHWYKRQDVRFLQVLRFRTAPS